MINFLNPLLENHQPTANCADAHPSRLPCIKRWLQDLSWSFGRPQHTTVKRGIDLVIAFAVLIVLAPLLILISILVKLDGGPAFFAQTRVGRYGRTFRMLKFRSMRVDAEEQLEALLAQNNKAEGITGEMSVVGPRPALPREVELYSENDYLRLLAKPGLTCLWQVGERRGGFWEVGDRNKIDFSEQVALDIRYLSQPSLLVDLRIMLKTVPAMFLGK